MTVGLFYRILRVFPREFQESLLGQLTLMLYGVHFGRPARADRKRPLVGQAPPLKVFFVEVLYQTPFFREPPTASPALLDKTEVLFRVRILFPVQVLRILPAA